MVVTDSPEAGRSCFQAFQIGDCIAGGPSELLDLHKLSHLDIFKTTVDEYEGLVRHIFPLLDTYRGDE